MTIKDSPIKDRPIKDGDWELFDYDPHSGRTVWRLADGALTHFRTDYPVDTLLDNNKTQFNESQGARFDHGQRIASIPLNLFFQDLEPAISQGDQKYVNRWLNNGDHRGFRTFDADV